MKQLKRTQQSGKCWKCQKTRMENKLMTSFTGIRAFSGCWNFPQLLLQSKMTLVAILDFEIKKMESQDSNMP